MRSILGVLIYPHDINNIEGIGDYVSASAVSFLGRYRIVDFPVSNMSNSGIDTIQAFIKEKPKSLVEHLDNGRQYNMNTKRGGIRLYFAPESRGNMTNYLTDVSTLYFNKQWIEREDKQYVLVANSNMIYTFDFDKLLQKHIESKADITVMYKECNNANKQFINCDVVELNRQNGVKSIVQNHGDKAKRNIMMGTYIMSKEIFLGMIDQGYHTSRLYWLRDVLNDACDYLDVRGFKYDGYFACVNSFKAYYDTSMELLDTRKRNQLFEEDWPIYTQTKDSCPTRYAESGKAVGSLVSNGCLIKGNIQNSIIGRRVNIGKNTVIRNSIVFPDVTIGDNVVIENAVVDKYSKIAKVKEIKGTEERPFYVRRGDII